MLFVNTKYEYFTTFLKYWLIRSYDNVVTRFLVTRYEQTATIVCG